jgi:ribosomal protein L32
MDVCEVCGEVVDKVHICADCGTRFCQDCGDPDPKKKLCAFCLKANAPFELYNERAYNDL